MDPLGSRPLDSRPYFVSKFMMLLAVTLLYIKFHWVAPSDRSLSVHGSLYFISNFIWTSIMNTKLFSSAHILFDEHHVVWTMGHPTNCNQSHVYSNEV